MHIGLAFDLQTDPADERQAEFDPPKTLDALEAALQSFGHRVTRLGNAEAIWRHPGHLSGIELVFNIAEGTHGRCREAWMPTLLDLFKVSYVGSDALALSVGLDKVLCKQLAMEAGLATPGWVAIHDPQNPPHPLRLQFPLIVKPRFEGSGRGIDAGAVVENKKALSDRLRWLHDHCPGAALVEEFIPEGELTVFLIGNAPSPRRFASQIELLFDLPVAPTFIGHTRSFLRNPLLRAQRDG
ncbi:MAG: D-alanine--D-alanine ligase, partial [Candidatus Omnitrophica bacterium]|nr:D-alanine--D-alanine ligase [Candidatus Omnitrophota bacterium]